MLVGTISVEVSELLSQQLDQRGIKHSVLNAKPEHAEHEGETIAEAGQPGAVTIATNMAGRGVDIKLGGNPEHLTRLELAKLGLRPGDPDFDERFKDVLPTIEKRIEGAHEEVLNAGGLFICGTERHESRRIDNQLRGRSGRQGDPGESRFFLSAEDDLVRLFAGERIYKILERFGTTDDEGNEEPIEAKMLTNQIEKAQKKVEEQNFLIRKRVLEYDDVMNQQREVIYEYRDRVLEGEDISDEAREHVREVIERLVSEYTPGDFIEDWDVAGLFAQIEQLFPTEIDPSELSPEQVERAELVDMLAADALEMYGERQDELGEELMRALERYLLLQIIDERWREHLYDMDYLREGIHLRGFAQIEPLVAYKNEAFTLFNDLMNGIWTDFVRMIFNVEVELTGPNGDGAGAPSPIPASPGAGSSSTASGRVSYSGGGPWAAPRPSPWPRPRPAPPRRPSRTARPPSRRCRCFRSRWSSATSTSTSRSAATIPAGADPARNSRSATGRSRSGWPRRPPRSRRRSAWRRYATSSSCSRTTFDPAELKRRVAALEEQMGAPGFWDDQERAARVSAEHARATRKLEAFERLQVDVEDLDGLAELADEDPDRSQELDEQVASVERRLAALEEERLFSGRYDSGDALVTVNAGAGGTDAQDWAEMVLRMDDALGGEARLQGRAARGQPGGGGRDQVGHVPGVRRQRVRPVLGREGRAPARAPLALRRREPAPDELRRRRGVARRGRERGREHRRRRPAGRHLPRERRGRPARQQDRLGGADHPPPDAASSCSARTSARSHRTRPPRWRCCARGWRSSRSASARRRSPREKGEAQDVNFGSQIRNYVLHPYTHGQGPAHRARGGRRPARPRRRPRRLRARLPAARGRRTN